MERPVRMTQYESEGLLLEEVKESHLPELLSIYNHYVRSSTATFHIAELGIEDLRSLVFHADPRCRTFVLLDAATGGVSGYDGISRYSPREAYDATASVHIYLDPAATGRGLGGKALRFLERYAAAQGFHVLLALVTEENERSAALFRKLGYVPCGVLHEVGRKFGRLLGVTIFERLLPAPASRSAPSAPEAVR
jgi:phosphinothricin acetyltransferase